MSFTRTSVRPRKSTASITRRVAVYLVTQSNIGSKRACCTGVTTVYLFTDATSQSVPRTHRFPYFCIMTQQNVNGSDRWNLLFSWAQCQNCMSPTKNSLMQGTSLGCRLVPKMIPTARNCAVWAVPLSPTPLKVPIFSSFGTCKTPAQKFGNFSTVYACIHRFMSFILKCSKSMQDKWPKVRVVLLTENTCFGILRWNPWGEFSYFLCECTSWPLT